MMTVPHTTHCRRTVLACVCVCVYSMGGRDMKNSILSNVLFSVLA